MTMNDIKYKALIKELGWTVSVVAINFLSREVEVDLSAVDGSTAVYDFDEVELVRSVGMKDKNEREMYEGDPVKFTKTLYTDCSRSEVQEILEPIVGELYYSDGVWLGMELEDGTGKLFMPYTIYSEEFEVLYE